jgi:hypothetical protein
MVAAVAESQADALESATADVPGSVAPAGWSRVPSPDLPPRRSDRVIGLHRHALSSLRAR